MSNFELPESVRRRLGPVPPASPRREAVRDCAAGVRAAIAAITETTASQGHLEAALAHLDAAVSLLRSADGEEPANSHTELGKEFGPMFGLSRPMAPPMHIYVEGDVIVGEVTFGPAYAGPPGHVYGGTIASAFDDVLALAPQADDAIAVTVALSVSYKKRTPIGVPLRFEGRVTAVDGRKVIATGVCLADGDVTATGEGVFIRVPRSAFDEH